MNAEQLRSLQMPLKEKYRHDPGSAAFTLAATGRVEDEGVRCRVATFQGEVAAGLHPATGGDGSEACSADMLLESLVGCAGVTLRAVATALNIPLRGATITAEGKLDFRGTLGVSKDAPVGLTEIRLCFDLDTDAGDQQIEKLLQLTERCCVVAQTLKSPPALKMVVLQNDN